MGPDISDRTGAGPKILDRGESGGAEKAIDAPKDIPAPGWPCFTSTDKTGNISKSNKY